MFVRRCSSEMKQWGIYYDVVGSSNKDFRDGVTIFQHDDVDEYVEVIISSGIIKRVGEQIFRRCCTWLITLNNSTCCVCACLYVYGNCGLVRRRIVGQVKRGWGVGARLLPVLGKGRVFGAVGHLNEKSTGSSVVTAEQSGCLLGVPRIPFRVTQQDHDGPSCTRTCLETHEKRSE